MCRRKQKPMSGTMLQSVAREIANGFGILNFKGSDGWLAKFRLRYIIRSKVLLGESASIDPEILSEWKLTSYCSEYEARNIFNPDKAGLFYRQLPTRLLVMIGEKFIGGEGAKERLSVRLCCSILGEKLVLLVIEKSIYPNAFKQQILNRKIYLSSGFLTKTHGWHPAYFEIGQRN